MLYRAIRTASRAWLLALAFAIGGTASRGDDWPQFRGPNRDNKVTGFTAPKVWPKELKKGWTVTVGEAVASPVLAGDKVYVFTLQGKEEVLTCLNAKDGKQVWQDKYAAEEVKGAAAGFKGQESFKGPRSTPAVGGGKVCTFGVAGVVSCVDADTGKLVWRKETKGKPQFFTSDSPLVADGLCVVHVGAPGKGELTAFDLAKGETKWAWSGDGPSYGSPVLATLGGTKQVVVLTDKNIVGVGFADGKLLWQAPLTGGRYNTGTPVIDGETVIISGTAFSITKDGEKFAAKQIWKDQAPHQYNTPVLRDGVLYGLTGQGRMTKLYAQDAKTGKVLWDDATARGECGTVLDAGAVLLSLSSNSELVVLKPSKDKFEEVAKYKVAPTPTWAVPIVAGNRVIVKDRDSITLWTVE